MNSCLLIVLALGISVNVVSAHPQGLKELIEGFQIIAKCLKLKVDLEPILKEIDYYLANPPAPSKHHHAKQCEPTAGFEDVLGGLVAHVYETLDNKTYLAPVVTSHYNAMKQQFLDEMSKAASDAAAARLVGK